MQGSQQIIFSPETFSALRKDIAWQEFEKLKQEIEKLKSSNRAYKGWRTKRDKKK